MSQRHSNIGDEGAAAFHAEGELAPSSRSAAPAGTIVKFPFQSPVAAASMALEDASSLDTFESLGELAVRLVADWNLPRLLVLVQQTREG